MIAFPIGQSGTENASDASSNMCVYHGWSKYLWPSWHSCPPSQIAVHKWFHQQGKSAPGSPPKPRLYDWLDRSFLENKQAIIMLCLVYTMALHAFVRDQRLKLCSFLFVSVLCLFAFAGSPLNNDWIPGGINRKSSGKVVWARSTNSSQPCKSTSVWRRS